MNKYFLFILLFSLCLFNCKKSTQVAPDNIKKSDKNIVVDHKTYSKVDAASLKKIESWSDYHSFNDFIQRFKKTSPDEAFDNVSELKDLTRILKDSLVIPEFNTPAFKSRLNVLQNEVLRLSDMARIPAITSQEANSQIDKILLVFGSLNDKINTLYSQKEFEAELDLDNLFTMDKAELIEPEKKQKSQQTENVLKREKTEKKRQKLKKPFVNLQSKKR